MDSPLAAVFLAIIALTALVQAAFVGALAIGLRLGNRRLGELEDKLDATLRPQIRNAARLTAQAAELADRSLHQARRVDALLAETSRKAERHLDTASTRLENAAGRVALRMEEAIESRTARLRDNAVLRRLAGAASLMKGVQRALEVWQASAAEADMADDVEDEDDDGADDGSPADPSPA